MVKNIARLREIFLARHGKSNFIPTPDEIKEIEAKIFVKVKDSIDPDLLDRKIIDDLETFITEKRWRLLDVPDFGLSIDALRAIRKRYEIIINHYTTNFEPRPLHFHLYELLIRQLELELQITKSEVDETKEETREKQDKVKKLVEESERDFKKSILVKESEIDGLRKKVMELESRNQALNLQYEKAVDTRIDEKKRSQEVEAERQANQEKIDNLIFLKEKLEHELHEFHEKSESSEREFEIERNRLKMEIEKTKHESSQILQEKKKKTDDIKKLQEIANKLKQENNNLQDNLRNNIIPDNLENREIYLISIDLNNIERSFNKNDFNLRLFDITSVFRQIHEILLNTTPSVDIYNVIGHVFCGPHIMKYQQISLSSEDENINNFASLFEWHETRLKKGKIPGTTKDKNQDTDTTLVAKTVRIISRYQGSIKAFFLVSGDKDDWVAIADIIKDENLGIPLHVIGKRGNIAQDIIKAEKFIHYLV